MIVDIVLSLAAVLLIVLGARVHALGGTAKAARWFALYCYVAALITVIEIVSHYSPTEEVARTWGQIAAIWPLAWVAYARFAVASTSEMKHRGLAIWVVSVAGAVIAVSYFLLARDGSVVAPAPDFGYSLESPFVNSAPGVVVAVAYALIIIITLTTLIGEALHTRGPARTRQIVWILLAYGLGFVVGVGLVLVREIGGIAIREINGLSYVVTATVIYAGIVSQRIVQLTPELVARQAFAKIDDWFVLTDDRYRVVTINGAAAQTLGVAPDLATGSDFRQLIGCAPDTPSKGDVTITRGTGEPVVLNLSESIAKNRLGEIIGRVFVGRDITEARRREQDLRSVLEEKELLLRELHHRVGNTLQILDGLVSIKTARLEPDDRTNALREISDRIHLLARAYHDMYADGTVQSVELERLLREISRRYAEEVHGQGTHEFELDLEPVWIPAETAVPLLLAVTELVSNACRHAYTNGKPDTIRIESRRTSPATWSIWISDDGIGISGEPPQTATGLQLAGELIAQIGGTMTAEGDHGTTWRITLPNQG